MLPDIPKLKELLKRKIEQEIINRLKRDEGFIVNKTNTVLLHEGGGVFERMEGDKVKKYKTEKIKEPFSFETEQLEKISYAELFNVMFNAILSLTIQKEKSLFKSFENTCKEVGNTFDAGGKIFDVEMLLTAFNKIEMCFDSKGNPIFPTIVMGKKLEKRMETELARLSDDREIKKQLERIIEIKREEWRERENSRKLVG